MKTRDEIEAEIMHAHEGARNCSYVMVQVSPRKWGIIQMFATSVTQMKDGTYVGYNTGRFVSGAERLGFEEARTVITVLRREELE